jgi:hypothetical protein
VTGWFSGRDCLMVVMTGIVLALRYWLPGHG